MSNIPPGRQAMPLLKMSMGFWLLLVSLLLLGCSSGGNPTAPGNPNDNTYKISGQVSDELLDASKTPGLLGIYELSINPSGNSAELVPKRISTIGESYIVSGISFFNFFPCIDCFKIKSVELTNDENILLTFKIRHPFKAGDPFKPPSGMNRLDLDIFDLALIIEPVNLTPSAFPLTNASINPDVCVSPDGYTRELSALTAPNDAALPYYLVIDESEISPIPDPTTWNIFAMGASAEFTAEFNLTTIQNMNFNLYLSTSYGMSAKRAGRLFPKYYNPEYNRKVAWKVVATPPQGNNPPATGNTWQNGDTTTAFNVKVEVYDWQIGAPVATAPNFEDADPGEIYSSSNPSTVSVEIPGMNNTLNVVNAPDNPSSTGKPGDPWIFTVPIVNENDLSEGEYHGLVKVTDERTPSTETIGRDFLISSPDGIALDNYLLPEFATYQAFTATVVRGGGQTVTNVWITVNRVEVDPVPKPKGGTFDPAQPWTLHWDPIIDAQEYAIYYDTDPGDYSSPTWTSDQLTDNLQFVDVTASTAFNAPPSHLPSNHYFPGNTYIIRARTVAGDPSSESENSEPAFIMINGWETTPAVHSPILDPALFEGWQAGWETSFFDPDPWHFYYYICTDDFAQNVLHGAKSARMSGCMIGQVNYPYPGRWDTITHRTPVVPNAPVRFLDCALQQWSVGGTPPANGGVCVGTVSDPRPFHPWATPSDFEWALVESTAPFDGYNNTQETFLRNTFSDVHTDAPWCWYSTNLYTTDPGWRVGCDLNATADPNDPYIAFGGAFYIYSQAYDQPNWFADDIAIMLY